MPFKLKWPFKWPRRGKAPAAQAAPDALPAATTPPMQAALAVEPRAPRAQPDELPLAERTALDAPEPGAPDLGADLLARAPAYSTPPTLGSLGGLKEMAQTLPAIDRFIQMLPAVSPDPALPGARSQTSRFAASLSASAALPDAAQPPAAQPEQLRPPSELTDVLPPLGSLPGQMPSLSGSAPIVEVHREPLAEPRAVEPRRAEASAPFAPLGAAFSPLAAPWGAPPSVADWDPARLIAPATEPGTAPAIQRMSQVLPPEMTLTGNVLPTAEPAPTQPAARPLRGAPADFGQPPAREAERLTPLQRQAIESQRGQGRPLEPEVRQRFEPALGQSLGAVRVHTGAAAQVTAQSLNALAFASGADVFFAPNTYQPSTPAGLGLLGHELAHVIQQQYGLPGDADTLRPPSDSYERNADLVAAQAWSSLAAQAAQPASGPQAFTDAPVQRTIMGQVRVESPWATQADIATAFGAQAAAPVTLGRAFTPDQPLASPPPEGPAAAGSPRSVPAHAHNEPAPVQRFSLSELSSLARRAPPAAGPSMPRSMPSMPRNMPSLRDLSSRASGLTDELPNPGGMLSNLGSMGQSMASGLGGLPSMGSLAGNLPSLSSLGGGLPDMGSLAGGLPQMPSLGGLSQAAAGLAGGLPSIGSLPSLGGLGEQAAGLAGGMAGGLPDMPPLGGLQGMASQVSPDMPLPPSIGDLGQAAGGAVDAAQGALGTITSMAPSMPEVPAAPQLPNIDKLTDQIWKQVQHKLRVERERSRGLA